MANLRLIKFMVQAGVSIGAMVFSMFMLYTGNSSEAYLPILTGVVGYWLPQPSLKKEIKNVQSDPVDNNIVNEEVQMSPSTNHDLEASENTPFLVSPDS